MSAGVHPMSANPNSCYNYQEFTPNATNPQSHHHHQLHPENVKNFPQPYHHHHQHPNAFAVYPRHAIGFPYHPHMQNHGNIYPAAECQVQDGYSQGFHHQRNNVMAIQQTTDFGCSQQPDTVGMGQTQMGSPVGFCGPEAGMGGYVQTHAHHQYMMGFNPGPRFPHHQYQQQQMPGNGYPPYQQPPMPPNSANVMMTPTAGNPGPRQPFPPGNCFSFNGGGGVGVGNPGGGGGGGGGPSPRYSQFLPQHHHHSGAFMTSQGHQMYAQQQQMDHQQLQQQQSAEGSFHQQSFFGQQCQSFHESKSQFSGNQQVQYHYANPDAVRLNYDGKSESPSSIGPPTCMMKSRSSSLQQYQFCEDRDDLGSEEGSQSSSSGSGGGLRPPADSGVSSCGDAAAYFSLNSSGELNNPPSVASDTFSTGSTSTPTPTPSLMSTSMSVMGSLVASSTSSSSSSSMTATNVQTMMMMMMNPLRTSSRCDSGKSESPQSGCGDGDVEGGGNDSGISEDVVGSGPSRGDGVVREVPGVSDGVCARMEEDLGDPTDNLMLEDDDVKEVFGASVSLEARDELGSSHGGGSGSGGCRTGAESGVGDDDDDVADAGGASVNCGDVGNDEVLLKDEKPAPLSPSSLPQCPSSEAVASVTAMEACSVVATGDARSSDGDSFPSVIVPCGWKREVHNSAVIYQSPSEVTLRSVDEVRTYLLSPGTCKCGLNCPINIAEIFNFQPEVKVGPEAPLSTSKLCNHRRKLGESLAAANVNGGRHVSNTRTVVNELSIAERASSSSSALTTSSSPPPLSSSTSELAAGRRSSDSGSRADAEVVDDGDVDSVPGGSASRCCTASGLQDKENIPKKEVAGKRRRQQPWTCNSACDSKKLVSNSCQQQQQSIPPQHQSQPSTTQDVSIQDANDAAGSHRSQSGNAGKRKRTETPSCSTGGNSCFGFGPSKAAKLESSHGDRTPPSSSSSTSTTAQTTSASVSVPCPGGKGQTTASIGNVARTPTPSFLEDPNAFMAQQVAMVNRTLMSNELLSPPCKGRVASAAKNSRASTSTSTAASVPALIPVPNVRHSQSGSTDAAKRSPSSSSSTACAAATTSSRSARENSTSSPSVGTESGEQFWSSATGVSTPPLVTLNDDDDDEDDKTGGDGPGPRGVDVSTGTSSSSTPAENDDAAPMATSSPRSNDGSVTFSRDSEDGPGGASARAFNVGGEDDDGGINVLVSDDTDDGEGDVVLGTGVGGEQEHDEGSVDIEEAVKILDADVARSALAAAQEEWAENGAASDPDVDAGKSPLTESPKGVNGNSEQGSSPLAEETDEAQNLLSSDNHGDRDGSPKEATAVEKQVSCASDTAVIGDPSSVKRRTPAVEDKEETSSVQRESSADPPKQVAEGTKSKPPSPAKERVTALDPIASAVTSMSVATLLPGTVTVSVATVSGTSMPVTTMTTDVLTAAAGGNLLASGAVLTDASGAAPSLPPLTVPIVTQVTGSLPTMHGFATAGPFAAAAGCGPTAAHGPPVLQLVNTLAGPMLVPTSMAAAVEHHQFGAGAQRIYTQVPVPVSTCWSSTAGVPLAVAAPGPHSLQQASPGAGKTYVPICASPADGGHRVVTTSPKRRSGGSNGGGSGGKQRQKKKSHEDQVQQQQQLQQQHQQQQQHFHNFQHHLHPPQHLIATSPNHFQLHAQQQLSPSAATAAPIALFASQTGAATAAVIPSVLPFGTFAIIPAPTAATAASSGKPGGAGGSAAGQVIISPNLVMQMTAPAQHQQVKSEPLPIQPGPAPGQQHQHHQHQAQNNEALQQQAATTLNFLQAFPMHPTFVAAPAMMDFTRVIHANSTHGVLPTGPNQPVIQTLTNGGLGQKFVLQPGVRPILAANTGQHHATNAQSLGLSQQHHLHQQQHFLSASSVQFQPMSHHAQDIFVATAAPGTTGEVCVTVASSPQQLQSQQPSVVKPKTSKSS